MKRFKIFYYFVNINNPNRVIIEEKIFTEPNVRLALNTHNTGYKYFTEYKKDKILINILAYLIDDNDNIITSKETYSPMTYDIGLAINHAIDDGELKIGVPPDLPR